MEKEQLTKTVVGKITELKDLIVMSREEGKRLGKVSHIYINPEEKNISGIVVKDEFWSRERLYFSMKDVETIGEDMILLNSAKSCQKISDESKISGISLKKLQGHGIITDDGKDLGKFKDANFQEKTWGISEIFMEDNNYFKVEVSKIKIGEDEILVPAAYASKVEVNVKNKKGFLSRLMTEEKGEDTFSESKNIIH
jgi:uncharacterized protein YrrD